MKEQQIPIIIDQQENIQLLKNQIQTETKQQVEDDKVSEQSSEHEIGKGQLSFQDYQRIQNQVEGALTSKQLEQFDKEGYIIIENILNQQEIIEGIGEIWDVLETMPQTENNVKFPKLTQQNLNIQTDQTEQINYLKFGILNEPRLYHTRTHWKLRQNPQLYKIFSQLLGTNQLWCSIDNTDIILPDGEEQSNKIEKEKKNQQNNNCQLQINKPIKPRNKYQLKIDGIVNLTERTYLCVPGSNKTQWQQQYKSEYLLNEGQQQQTVTESTEVKDPWDLGQVLSANKDQNGNFIEKSKTQFGCTREIKCPQGSVILFHNRTMRTLNTNQTNKIVYGYMLSFFPAGNRDLMAVYNRSNWKGWQNPEQLAHKGDSELSDRLRSYYSNAPPYRQPNGHIILYHNKSKLRKSKKNRNRFNIKLKAIESQQSVENFESQNQKQSQLQQDQNVEQSENDIKNNNKMQAEQDEKEEIDKIEKIVKKCKYDPPTLTELGQQVLGSRLYPGMNQPYFLINNEKLDDLEKNGLVSEQRQSTEEEEEKQDFNRTDESISGCKDKNMSSYSEKIQSEQLNQNEDQIQNNQNN